MFQHIHIVTAWRIDRGCSRMLEHEQQNTSSVKAGLLK